jgi:hypothetical protein
MADTKSVRIPSDEPFDPGPAAIRLFRHSRRRKKIHTHTMVVSAHRFSFLRQLTFWVFAALLVAEFLRFDSIGAMHHTRIYPGSNNKI